MASFSKRLKSRRKAKLPSERAMSAKAFSPTPRSEALMVKANASVIHQFKAIARESFDEYLEALESQPRFDAKEPITDILISKLLGDILGKMKTIKLGAWDRNRKASNRDIARRSAQQVEALGLPLIEGTALEPIFENGKRVAMDRIVTLQEFEVERLGKQLTKARGLTGKGRARYLARTMGADLLTKRQVVKLMDLSASGEDQAGIEIQEKKMIAHRSELIARDQVLSQNAEASERRATDAGVRKYVWMTANDERVRHNHAALHGTTQSFDAPPLGGGTSPEDTGNAGTGINCRCSMFPLLPELEGLDAPEVKTSAALQGVLDG